MTVHIMDTDDDGRPVEGWGELEDLLLLGRIPEIPPEEMQTADDDKEEGKQ